MDYVRAMPPNIAVLSVNATSPFCSLQKHAELLESYAKREAAAADYVREVRPGLEVHTGELHDAKVGALMRYAIKCRNFPLYIKLYRQTVGEVRLRLEVHFGELHNVQVRLKLHQYGADGHICFVNSVDDGR